MICETSDMLELLRDYKSILRAITAATRGHNEGHNELQRAKKRLRETRRASESYL